MGRVDLAAREHVPSCMQAAEDGAIRHINLGDVTAFYETKTGRTLASLAAN